MISSSIVSRLSVLVLDVADTIVLPRFRQLSANEMEEKSPGEIVSVVDREAERAIASGLTGLIPQARIVGEEGAALAPHVMRGLDDGLVWLVDPLDGTSNFVVGRNPFAIMVALLRQGETILSVILDPLEHRLYCAEKGAGAYCGNARVLSNQNLAEPETLSGAVLTRFLPEDLRANAITRAAASRVCLLPGLLCAGAEYPALADGDRHFALFWRTLPWDHAPGALFLSEAGGSVTRWDGAPYRPGDNRSGLLAARNPAVAEYVQREIIIG